MNEELQSTNDELQTINDTLRDRTGELDAANDFLAAVLESLQSAVAVVDTDLIVQAWNQRAADLWGVRSDEATGQHLLNLDIGLPTDRLRPLVRDALAEEPPAEPDPGDRAHGHLGDRGHSREAVSADRAASLTVEAVNRRGRTVEIAVTAAPLRYRDQDRGGAIIVMDQREGPAAG